MTAAACSRVTTAAADAAPFAVRVWNKDCVVLCLFVRRPESFFVCHLSLPSIFSFQKANLLLRAGKTGLLEKIGE